MQSGGGFVFPRQGQINLEGADVVSGHIAHRKADRHCGRGHVELLPQVKKSVLPVAAAITS